MSLRAAKAAILALLLPGAGHVFVGRVRRGLAFSAIIVMMFGLGTLLHGKLYVFRPGLFLNNLATLGSMGNGILYVLGRWVGVSGDVTSSTYEHGTAFMLTAGLMNLLVVLDAWDLGDDGDKRE